MLAVNLVLIGGPVALTSLIGVVWMQPLVLVALVASEFGIYRLTLPAVARLVEERRETLVEAATTAM